MKLHPVTDRRREAYARRRLAQFTTRCREGGLAVTPQRLAIIEALLAATDHPRAESIYAEVRKQHPHISLATVHRTLETLCQIGEARKVTPLYDSARYDGNLEPHHHVTCVRCRRIVDVEISGLEELGELEERGGLKEVLDGHAALSGFALLGWSLEVRALCDSCRESPANAAR